MMRAPHNLFTPEGSAIDPNWRWHCEPTSWSADATALTLTIRPDEHTDFWQRTHYDFQADNGHLLWTPVDHDIQMSVDVSMRPLHQYDQAGLMLRLSPECWLKTSVEYEGAAHSRLGCVVTNRGYSDWSTQDVPSAFTEFSLRVTTQGATCLVEAQAPGMPSSQLRLAQLAEYSQSRSIQCGIYACSPKAAGFEATFRNFSLEARDAGRPLS